jgi:hypothetical protein
MAEAGKRPFWMHQIVEYILGGALVASGMQSVTPLVPAVLGGLIMLNAALTKGALGAFRAYGRSLHRTFDIGIIILSLVAVGQPWLEVDAGTRIIILAITTVQIVVFFGSSYAERQRKVAPAGGAGGAGKTGDRSTDLGRSAGRIAGSGVNAVRKLINTDDQS